MDPKTQISASAPLDKLEPVSTEVPAAVKQALIGEGAKAERTLAAQTRMVLRLWHAGLARP